MTKRVLVDSRIEAPKLILIEPTESFGAKTEWTNSLVLPRLLNPCSYSATDCGRIRTPLFSATRLTGSLPTHHFRFSPTASSTGSQKGAADDLWNPAFRMPELRPGQIHLWCASLDHAEESSAHLMANVLSAEERARARRFRSASDRDAYVLRRGMLRTILGRYLSRPSSDVRIGAGPHGKPCVQSGRADQELGFNATSSGGLAVVAAAGSRSVGVDVEKIREMADMDQLAALFLSSREFGRFCQTPSTRKLGAFFRLWTAKEALLKGWGCGLLHPPRDIEVPAEIWEEETDWVEAPIDCPAIEKGITGKQWLLRRFDCGDEWIGTLAFEGPVERISCWRTVS
jgi:4'-phosphopantetheinyl transferase